MSGIDPQHSLLSILYILLIIIHSYTWTRKDFHRKLITIFSLALLMRTISTLLVTFIKSSILTNSNSSKITPTTAGTSISLDPTIENTENHQQQYQNQSLYNEEHIPRIDFILRDVAQLLRIISTNFFILFLLIIAKGWPITRRDIPFKYAFAIFWTLCLMADLIIFYWSKNRASSGDSAYNHNYNDTKQFEITTINPIDNQQHNSTASSANILPSSSTISSQQDSASSQNSSHWTDHAMIDHYDGTVKICSFVLRITYMIYFLSQLRKTMTLEQDQRKLQFYLHFGALSMVWFVHSVIVYAIALRVDKWQAKLINGFSSAADFLAFAVTTRLLWPRISRSHLFRKYSEGSGPRDPPRETLALQPTLKTPA